MKVFCELLGKLTGQYFEAQVQYVEGCFYEVGSKADFQRQRDEHGDMILEFDDYWKLRGSVGKVCNGNKITSEEATAKSRSDRLIDILPLDPEPGHTPGEEI